MISYEKFGLADVEFRTRKSRALKGTEVAEILRLRKESLEIDFPERSPKEIAHFLMIQEAALKNPNNAVGGPTISRSQSYARSLSIAAYRQRGHNRQLVAQLTVADNASYSLPDDPNYLQRLKSMGLQQAKLRLRDWEYNGKLLVKSRWCWLGLLAVSQIGRHMINDTHPDDANLVDIMIAAGVGGRDERQPASSYPYREERLWKSQLGRIGLSFSGDTKPVPSFGEAAGIEPVQQERWTIESVGGMKALIFEKQGAEEHVARVLSK
ncbi:MAG TPA: hypothetical protein VLG13_01155 [Patescibacteria group bacterium]|nr:hypothetical protein [Patescibacteria group bacterium]